MTDPTEAISVLNEAQSLIEALCQFKQKLAMLSKRLAEPQLNFVEAGGKMTEAAAARAIQLEVYDYDHEDGLRVARAVLTAVTPLIEAAALEKAAKVVEEGWGIPSGTPQDEVAAAIRALSKIEAK